VTTATFIATVAAGVFAGASAYVSVVDHPARLECGPALAIKGLGPATRRAAAMQGALAMLGLVSSVVAWFQGSGIGWLVGGLLLAVLVPYTLLVIKPINRRLLDPGFDPSSAEAARLLSRWGWLHAVRTLLGLAAFVDFVVLSRGTCP
jgi:hypothetical protein